LADTIALVGGETLLGREVRDVFSESSLGAQLRLVAATEEDTGTLTSIAGEAAFLAKLAPEAVEDAAVVILAGTPESSRTALDAHPPGLIIDLTGVLEDDPDARVRAPLAEDPDQAAGYIGADGGPQVVAHPAAIALACILRKLHQTWPIQRSVVQIFQPASEQGRAGVEELQQQTVNLLSFAPLPKQIFDAQVAWAMLAQLGGEAQVRLGDIEERIERHLASLLGASSLDDGEDSVPMPSLRLIHAPVFHGYSFSLWVEFQDSPSAADMEDVLRDAPFDLRPADLEPPNNVSVAGQSGIAVGAIAADRNNGNAVWIWAAADNLRLVADNAMSIARERL
jgi:aspartate-semialdehyde dehydrogenase